MKKIHKLITTAVMLIMIMSAAKAQQPNAAKQAGKSQQASAAAATPVTGSGTPGQLSKWTGVEGTNTYTLGDSVIFEDKFGKLGIGTKTPTSLLTIKGMVETTLGGYKFPDGTVQTTAAVTGLQSVFHNETLTGYGTAALPLGVAIPLSLSGDAKGSSVINATNTGTGGGVFAFGGSGDDGGGFGLTGVGGFGNNKFGGNGVEAFGGASVGFIGGSGVYATGGDSTSSGLIGGAGLDATGGNGNGNGSNGGYGVKANGGNSNNSFGGSGVKATGGTGSGAGVTGGHGIFAVGGAGINGATTGFAGFFQGKVSITGNLSKGGGSFKIDHPLDPENKYLYHSFVESPDMMNIYNGNITTDANGDAVVELPDYFNALNKDFRYQLTVIGQFAQAIVASKVKGNRFAIKTNAANVEVSWQVTGIRQDAFANQNRIPVEELKSEDERGYYLHPDAFNQPEEKSLVLKQHPELLRQIQEIRDKAQKQKLP